MFKSRNKIVAVSVCCFGFVTACFWAVLASLFVSWRVCFLKCWRVCFGFVTACFGQCCRLCLFRGDNERYMRFAIASF